MSSPSPVPIGLDPTRGQDGDWFHHSTLPGKTEELYLDIEHVLDREPLRQFLGPIRFQLLAARLVSHVRRIEEVEDGDTD